MSEFSAFTAAIRELAAEISAGRLITSRSLDALMTGAFGAQATSGTWDWRTAYDAMEAAAAHGLARSGGPSLDALRLAETMRPTQTRRSEEQLRLQQFSTPLPYALIAARAGAPEPDDLVLEPSAGCGALAAAARSLGTRRLILNEIDPRRRAALKAALGTDASGHDAAMIDDMLAPGTLPSLVLMNPPFAASFDRSTDRTMAARHLLSALKRLAPGGRLVAIMPTGFSPQTQYMRPFWAECASRARIRMVMSVDRSVYRKQGTGVDTKLVVMDKASSAIEPGDAGLHEGYAGDILGGASALECLNAALRHLPPRARPERPEPVTLRPAPRPMRAKATLRSSSRQPTATALPAAALSALALETPLVNAPVSDVYAAYQPQRIAIEGAQPHPTALVESLAMASVAPPVVRARPVLPPKLIESGDLSAAQLETVIYARAAHERWLEGRWTIDAETHAVSPAGEDEAGAVRFRAGFFLGDGTGCGKGRQAAAVILDNWLSGRRRALWISKSEALLEDARRDWRDIGGAPTDIRPLSSWKPGEEVSAASGILFATYATLRSVGRDGSSRLDQMVQWLTEDRPDGEAGEWGPVIVFDESHAMGNAAGGANTGRGASKPSQQGLRGLRLQVQIPEARVFYASATGATTVENLAYATRLGLWGAHPAYPFANREAFLTAMHAGGVAAMEVVARDLKAMGLYLARSLSFEGVEYEMLTHELTADQRALWDEWAGAFRIIHHNLEKALRATNLVDEDGTSNNAQAKSAVMSRFEGLKQRFFNHLLTGFKTPSLIAHARQDLADGRSVVIQLVSTGEALLNRRLDALGPDDEDGISGMSFTPAENVLDYLHEAFPVNMQRVVEDENGNLSTAPVMDPETGAPVISQEALRLREETIEKLAMAESVPAALDQIIEAFGEEMVAEATGRTKRPLFRTEGGERRIVIASRSASASNSETKAFMDGTKRIMVFSEAGGTGRSYHAALSAANQQQRVHYLLEPGWKADAAVQGLGRSHRSAQASTPIFRVLSTDVKGEKRFISTIARRLDTLGALTKGQRQTGSQGLFRAEDSLESDLARRALRGFYRRIIAGKAQSVTSEAFTALTGLKLTAQDGAPLEDMPPMARFLNRLLALEIGRQNEIFSEFEEILAGMTEAAREAGSLDIGVETIRASRLQETSRREIACDERTGAVSELVEMERADPVEVLALDEALDRHKKAIGWFLHYQSGEPVFAHRAASEVMEDGTLIPQVTLYGVERKWRVSREEFENGSFQEMDAEAFFEAWSERVGMAPVERVTRFFILTGLLLPLWKHLPQENQKIWRAVTDSGASVLGRVLTPEEAGRLSGVLAPVAVQDAASLLAAVTEQKRRIPLQNGAVIALRRAGGGERIEIENAPREHLAALKAIGCFTEIIAWKTRVFIPAGDEARHVLEAVLKITPLTGEAAPKAA